MSDLGKCIELIRALAEFAWPATLLGLIFWFRKPISNLFEVIKEQLKRGASIRYGELELKGVKLSEFPLNPSSRYRAVAADHELLDQRKALYDRQKCIFLVHRAIKTETKHEKSGATIYDLSIYLVIHKEFGALNDIKEVEYYFGQHFKENDKHEFGSKYVVGTASNGFAIRTTAYGPTLCEARVSFHDGDAVIMQRYLDFEGNGYVFDPAVVSHDEGLK